MSSHAPRLAATATVAICVLFVPPRLFAQTPPRPAVTLRQHPSMLRSVLPADFNRDGHIDFVAGEPRTTSAPGRVVVRLGNGGGGVGQPLATGVSGRPATIGDFNNDTLIDLVAIDDAGAMSVLAGIGNGRFQPPQALGGHPFFRFAIAADMNGDSRLDLVIGNGTRVFVVPGNGDLTFRAATILPPGSDEEGFSAGVAADLNRDGRRDLVIAQAHRSIIVYTNTGSLIFVPSEIVIEEFEDPDEIHGLAAADLNRDGRVDLIVPHAQGIFDFGEGGVDVLIGRGNGTFAPAARYATGVTGPWTATTGDFNRDGFVDVVVGGRSWVWNDLSDIKSYWDSVAIFPGLGNGTLAPAAPFRLDTRTPFAPRVSPWVNEHHALHTADVNGDGHDDLVASPLAILLNRAAAPNRPPTADAGPDLVDPYGESVIVGVRMTEPDWDWLRVEWRDQFGDLLTTETSFEFNTLEDRTLTVTVTDARGATATDTVIVRRDRTNPFFITPIQPLAGEHFPSGFPIPIRWDAFDGSALHHFQIDISRDAFSSWQTLADDLPATTREFTWVNAGPPGMWRARVLALGSDRAALAIATTDEFRIDTTPMGEFPWPWEEAGDLGAVGVGGDASYANGTFSIRGAGSGVGGTADEFHFVDTSHFITTQFGGSRFTVTARVTSIENIGALTRAGLMIRDDFTPGGRHASVFVTPTATNGVTFERRHSTGGANGRSRTTSISGPAWVKLVRDGPVVRAYARKNTTDAWTLVGRHTFDALPLRVHVMLVVTSSIDATPALARFDNVEIDETESSFSTDIRTTLEGRTTTDDVTTTIEASGVNIWDRADSFRYHYTVEDLSRGGSITARVRSLENTHSLAKAGIMIRNGFDPGAAHVSLFVTPGGGIRLQFRRTLHAESAQAATRSGVTPEWLRLTRNGNVFTAWASDNGETWSRVGAVTVPMYELTFVGLAVTSHDPAALATAVFDDVVIRR